MAHEKVSLEEIRAKRLAKEQEQPSHNDTQDEMTSQTPSDEQAIGGSPEPQPYTGTPPQPASAPELSPVADSPAIPNLDDLLTSATPEQLQRIRMLAASKGLSVPASGSGTKHADGSMTVSVFLEGPVVEQLEIWAEADGCSLVEEAQKRISEALTNYLYGDWNPIPEPAPVAATVTTAAAK